MKILAIALLIAAIAALLWGGYALTRWLVDRRIRRVRKKLVELENGRQAWVNTKNEYPVYTTTHETAVEMIGIYDEQIAIWAKKAKQQ